MWQKIKPYILPYAVGIAIPLAVGVLSALFTRGNMDVYSNLNSPPLAPPAILFPIVWTVLYILMGISSTNVYIKRERNTKEARCGLIFYGLSLVFNFLWSIIFFNVKGYLFSFIWLILLLYLIISTVVSYRKVSLFSAYLQIPYIVWVVFAGYLNFGVWFLNK